MSAKEEYERCISKAVRASSRHSWADRANYELQDGTADTASMQLSIDQSVHQSTPDCHSANSAEPQQQATVHPLGGSFLGINPHVKIRSGRRTLKRSLALTAVVVIVVVLLLYDRENERALKEERQVHRNQAASRKGRGVVTWSTARRFLQARLTLPREKAPSSGLQIHNLFPDGALKQHVQQARETEKTADMAVKRAEAQVNQARSDLAAGAPRAPMEEEQAETDVNIAQADVNRAKFYVDQVVSEMPSASQIHHKSLTDMARAWKANLGLVVSHDRKHGLPAGLWPLGPASD